MDSQFRVKDWTRLGSTISGLTYLDHKECYLLHFSIPTRRLRSGLKNRSRFWSLSGESSNDACEKMPICNFLQLYLLCFMIILSPILLMTPNDLLSHRAILTHLVEFFTICYTYRVPLKGYSRFWDWEAAMLRHTAKNALCQNISAGQYLNLGKTFLGDSIRAYWPLRKLSKNGFQV